jgi:lipoate-protein ligase A
MNCQIFPYQSADGPTNMALDEALLDAVAADPSSAMLRTYGWTEPTLSLGYFQAIAGVEADPRWHGRPLVRRPTGGGAIWHHHEVTYALVIPSTHPLARPNTALYYAVHSAIVSLLGRRGIAAERRGPARGPRDEVRPFLCFTDRDPEDIVIEGVKIVGSAQRRRIGAILQHGSLLLMRSDVTPELPGAGDLVPISADLGSWSAALEEELPRALGLSPTRAEFTLEIRRRAADLERQVYRNPTWDRRR